jgi:hypothetical protein
MTTLAPRLVSITLLLTAASIAAHRFGASVGAPEHASQPIAPAPALAPSVVWQDMQAHGVPNELHQALQAHRGLAQAIASVPPAGASLDSLQAMAPYSLDHRLREELTMSLGVSPVELSVLLQTSVGRGILDYCPQPRLDPICDGGWRMERTEALTAHLIVLLGSTDDVMASQALDLVCEQGASAQPIAEAALQTDSLRTRAVGLVAAGCVFEADRARALMQQHIGPSDPLAAVAALELGRLGQSQAALEALETDQSGSPPSLFAAYGLSRLSTNTQDRSSP